MQTKLAEQILTRLTRIESKVARGFEELGIGVNTDHDWLTVDEAARVVYLSTLGRSLQVVLTDMKRRGATQKGRPYTLIHRGEEVGTVIFAEVV